MFVLVGWQLAVTALCVIICRLFFDFQAAFSLMLGGLSYAVPTLAAVWVWNALKYRAAWRDFGVFAALAVKIVLVLCAMAASVLLHRELRFLPYLIGFFVASHLAVVFFVKVHRYGK